MLGHRQSSVIGTAGIVYMEYEGLCNCRATGVDKGGPGGPGPPMAGQKNFLVKIEGLLCLPPAKSGRACHDNPTGRGYVYFYQMPNMYTCIAYLIEIRKFC